jgi:hypothetical protein
MANGYKRVNGNQTSLGGSLLVLFVALLVYAAIFFIMSAIFMGLWNSVVKKALKDGAINKIDYPTAMGLTFFIAMFFTSTVVVGRCM